MTIGRCVEDRKCKDEDYPFYRLTGVTISMSMEYVNFKNVRPLNKSSFSAALLSTLPSARCTHESVVTDVLRCTSVAMHTFVVASRPTGWGAGTVSVFSFLSERRGEMKPS